jgi:hypothetical protein
LIPRRAHAHVQRKVAMDQRNREGLALVRLESVSIRRLSTWISGLQKSQRPGSRRPFPGCG